MTSAAFFLESPEKLNLGEIVASAVQGGVNCGRQVRKMRIFCLSALAINWPSISKEDGSIQ